MKTLPCLTLAAALFAAAPTYAQPGAPTDAQEAPEPGDLTATGIKTWRTAHVQADGYSHAFDWEDHARYVRPANGAKATDPQLRLWVREEYFKAHMDEDGAHRSNLSLVVLDCTMGRYRTLASDAYPKLNLGGDRRSNDSQDIKWIYPRPESVDEQLVFYGCVFLKRADGERP